MLRKGKRVQYASCDLDIRYHDSVTENDVLVVDTVTGLAYIGEACYGYMGLAEEVEEFVLDQS